MSQPSGPPRDSIPAELPVERAPSGLDVRWPLGLLFAMIGALLLGHGLTQGDAVAAHQAAYMNAWWGGVLLLFGGSMLWLARRGRRKTG